MEVCIIGAGMAGVCTAKHSLQNGFKTTVFEQTGAIGGTWVYTDTTEKDEYGLDIHSSMYKSLHTNLPKEIMGFPDFPFPELEMSYVPAKDVLQFIRDYAENFKVNDLIKFQHYVVRVRPYNGRWEVVVKDLPNNKYLTYNFDFVFICNGHYQEPLYPTIEGLDSFSGTTIHSHYYREPQPFRDETVLVIGAGPSGRDIAEEVSHVAKKVFISHHEPKEIKGAFTSNVVQKPDCLAFRDGNIVEFKDGSKEKITKILFCTGYKFTFPFLSMDSGVTIEDNYVKPLYKHCISINSPRLAFIGLCFRSLISHMLDIQVRFAFSYFTGRKTLPSRKEMLQDMEKDIKERAERGLPIRKGHMLANEQEQYYNDLAATAEIENVKPVIMKLYFENQMNNKSNYLNFRKNKYKIVDDENFVQIFD